MYYKTKHTGKVPGTAASNVDTHEFTGAPNSTFEPEKSFERVRICAWISRPTTLFHLRKIKYINYIIDSFKSLNITFSLNRSTCELVNISLY